MDLKISIILLWVEYNYNCGRSLLSQVLDKPEIVFLQIPFYSPMKGRAVQSRSVTRPSSARALQLAGQAPENATASGHGDICVPRMSRFCDRGEILWFGGPLWMGSYGLLQTRDLQQLCSSLACASSVFYQNLISARVFSARYLRR